VNLAPPRTAADPAVSYLPHMRRPANWITLAGLAAGLAAGLVVVSRSPLWEAAALIGAAMAADFVDGAVARRTGTASPFGHGLDSLADTVSFGAVPAFAAWSAQLHQLGAAGCAVALLWAMAVTARLALYLVRGHQPVNRGLPGPPAGVALVALAAAGAPAGWVLAVAVALSVAMLAPFPVPVTFALKELSHAPDANPLAGHQAAGPARVPQ
jgi:CDP-diacylglycerol---serine O-phosphatidyltransferase